MALSMEDWRRGEALNLALPRCSCSHPFKAHVVTMRGGDLMCMDCGCARRLPATVWGA